MEKAQFLPWSCWMLALITSTPLFDSEYKIMDFDRYKTGEKGRRYGQYDQSYFLRRKLDGVIPVFLLKSRAKYN